MSAEPSDPKSLIRFVDQGDALRVNELIGMEAMLSRIGPMMKGFGFRTFATSLGGNMPRNFENFIIEGPPGVGKTTFAKAIAFDLGERGAAPLTEPVRIVKASSLIGTHTGFTTRQVQGVLKEAELGILIIDDLGDILSSNFAGDIINCLNGHMSESKNRPLIIATCYADKTEEIMKLNPGLRKRFGYKFSLPGYDDAQLLAIMEAKLEASCFSIGPDAMIKVINLITEAKVQKGDDFANGREIEHILDQILKAVGERLEQAGVSFAIDDSLTNEQKTELRHTYLHIMSEDIPAYNRMSGEYIANDKPISIGPTRPDSHGEPTSLAAVRAAKP